MTNQLNQPFLTTKQLLERGWTKMLIKRFLPTPDGCDPVSHWKNYRGQDTYAAVKIWNVEQTADFEKAFLETWNGRMKTNPLWFKHFSLQLQSVRENR